MNLNKKEKGFTLIEVIITLAILGIVSTAAFSLIGTMRSMEKDSDKMQIANVLIQNTVDNIEAMSTEELKTYVKKIKNSEVSNDNPFEEDYKNTSNSSKILEEISTASEVFQKINKNYSNTSDFKAYSTNIKDVYVTVKIPKSKAADDKLGIDIDIDSNSDKAELDKGCWIDKDKADGIISIKKDLNHKLMVEIKNKNSDSPTSEESGVTSDIDEDKYLEVVNSFEEGKGSVLSYNSYESEICSNIRKGEKSEKNIYIEDNAAEEGLVVKIENQIDNNLNVYIENMLNKNSKLQIIPEGNNIKIYTKNSSENTSKSYDFKNVCEIIVEAYYVNEKTEKPKLIHSIKTYKIIDKD